MEISRSFTLSVEDIRYLRPVQLSLLTGFDPSYFSAWSSRRSISERSLARMAERLGVSKSDLLKSFELRRQDAAIARAAQARANQLIAALPMNSERA